MSAQMTLMLQPERRVFTVADLNHALQRVLESDFRGIFVAGEISGCRAAASGHYYFSLKDATSQVKAVLFKGNARNAKFKPQDGLAVIARGNLDVYEARGEYQLIVDQLEPQGAGALQVAFEQLKKKLAAEGLFDAARKRALPSFPKRIGIVTSASGAVIRDILHVLDRRFRGLHIRLFPAQVQGEGSIEQVCAGIQHFSSDPWADVVIVARGGGSLEDLWTFNEEAVARTVAESRPPVISAVGHETDFTICDFVADLRAPTPSAAAEVVICTKDSLLESIAAQRSKALQGVRYKLIRCARDLHARGTERAQAIVHRSLSRRSQQLDELDYRMKRAVQRCLAEQKGRTNDLAARVQRSNPQLRLAQQQRALEAMTQQITKCTASRLTQSQRKFEALSMHLTQMSPLTVLSRGYAIVQDADGHAVRSASEVQPGDALRVRVHVGEIAARVTDAKDRG